MLARVLLLMITLLMRFFFFQAEDGIRDVAVTGVQTCALPILNFTSTKPSASDTLFLTHHGNVPLPICCRTFFPLGAVGSAPPAHRGLPEPVTPDRKSVV